MGISTDSDSTSIALLLVQINNARTRMQQLWDRKGYTDNEVLAASIEVDRLLNEYDRMTGFSIRNGKIS